VGWKVVDGGLKNLRWIFAPQSRRKQHEFQVRKLEAVQNPEKAGGSFQIAVNNF